MVPIILSGGVGSRLWPLSRGLYPKQMLPLVDLEQSMLQQTVARATAYAESSSPIIVCNEDHRFMVGEQLQAMGCTDATIMLEPEGRNTAPAIALAALHAMRQGEDPLLLVMPADHRIADQNGFLETVAQASALAEAGNLVTFGIVATQAETGYGYIQRGEENGIGYHVVNFKEKPNAEVAQSYLDSGDYYWNGGIFLFKASSFLQELNKFEPEIVTATSASESKAQKDLDFIRVDAKEFAKSPSVSIDYAVMERTECAVVVPLDAGWNDVGSWSALWEVADKDDNGNAIVGDVLTHEAKNSHIYSESKLVSAVGVEDLVIVETADAILVAGRDRAQDVKYIVKQLSEQNRSHVKHHRKVFRPWGWYDSIDSGDRFQVKRIMVNPGAKLSVQMHHYRAEHWVVVKGVAEVRNGDKVFTLNENQSTYIPIGVTHSLHNPSATEGLEIIEVQSGSYLGEDDIVRFDDEYGRAD